MRPRLPLWAKILFIAFLNLCLLALAVALIVRAQFRVDAGSFLLAPAQSRIMSAAQAIALELETTPRDSWSQLLARFSKEYSVELALFDDDAQQIAGPALAIPRDVSSRIPQRQRRQDARPREPRPEGGRRGPEQETGPPQQRRGPEQPRSPEPEAAAQEKTSRRPAPPLFLTATSSPARYWAGARIPVRIESWQNPRPCTLILMSSSLLTSRLFFDVRPWLTIGFAVILVSMVCWLPFIRGMTRSISQMTRVAEQIAEGRFDAHVADRRHDEIGQLGAAINRMASRLSSFVEGQKRFLSGIAHELCTPLATIQFGLGNLERRVNEQQRESVADIQEEAQHMSALVNELLSFSRAGMKALDIKMGPVNVADTVARVLEREASPEVRIENAVPSDLIVMADSEYLFRALSNVVRNAIRYAGHAGPIQISTREALGAVSILVADCGPGVPDESLEDIFAPFYRLDPARGRDTGGLGLGLAIVRACVESCRGAVRCRNRQPSGLEVEIRLPAAEL
jgi:two-component system, OmpR family, sensor histidine kinase CpxA